MQQLPIPTPSHNNAKGNVTGQTNDLGSALALVAFRVKYIMLKRAGKQAA